MSLVALMPQLREWRGVPWRHQGRLKTGVDCVGLVLAWARICGKQDPKMEIPNYGRLPHHGMMYRLMKEYADEVPFKDARVGDVLLATWKSEPIHVGVLSDYGDHGGDGEPFGLIHADIRTRAVVEQPFRAKDFTIRGVFRFRE